LNSKTHLYYTFFVNLSRFVRIYFTSKFVKTL
jgi:hypothetical protein